MSDDLPQQRVMNTRTHSVEPFEPREPGLVRMYVCGPSVYDESHLGHARSYVVYDAIKRTLQARGLRVRHVQNFTDVEENIAQRAAKEGVTPLELAQRLIDRFFEDMDALHVLRADAYPRVSESIDDIIDIVRKLQKSGFAYSVDCGPREHVEAACDVYFDVSRVRDFGLLAGGTLEELAVDKPTFTGDRRHAMDFALWKTRTDWGVTWPSHWGPGRPGWHVECAAMALAHLGADFDIHGGGLDLVFPHHESERVIGEAVTGKRYCNHYLHNGFITVGDHKMSKSLGNFVTIGELLGRHDPEELRAFLLSRHYRAPLNYDEAEMEKAAGRVQKWRATLKALRTAAGDAAPTQTPPPGILAARAAFWAALADDFRFDAALDAIDAGMHAAEGLDKGEARAALTFFKEAEDVTGLLWTR